MTLFGAHLALEVVGEPLEHLLECAAGLAGAHHADVEVVEGARSDSASARDDPSLTRSRTWAKTPLSRVLDLFA